MAVQYHTHSFEIPTATKADVQAGVISDKVVVPSAVGSAAAEDVSAFATAIQGGLADGSAQKSANLSDLDDSDAARASLGLGPASLSAIRQLTVKPDASEYQLMLPPLPNVDQFKTGINTYNDALTDAKAFMSSLGTAAGSGPGMFIVAPGTNLGDSASYAFADTIAWYMSGSKGYGSSRSRIEQHVSNTANWPGFSAHHAHAFPVERYFDGSVGTNGYDKAGAAIHALAMTGQNSPAVGTPFAFMQEHLVFDMATPTSGRNEPAINYAYIEAVKGKTQNKANFWAEDTIAISPTMQSGWFGGSRRLHKMWGTNDADPNHWLGSAAYGAVTRPLLAAEAVTGYGGSRINDVTSVIDAMFRGVGWAGQITAGDTVNSGTAVGATVGIDSVFWAGGPGGSPYISPTARSFINTALRGEDYAKDGILLQNPHPTFDNNNYAAIRIAQDAGRLFLGINGGLVGVTDALLAVGNSTAAGGSNIFLSESRDATSKRTGINFNNAFLMGSDFGSGGTQDFFLYHNATATRPFSVGTGGLFNLNDSALYRAGTKVVDTRRTGWTLMTGGTLRGGFDTATVTLPQLAAIMKALLDDLFAHGLIGS